MTHLREEPEIVKLGEAESGTVVAGGLEGRGHGEVLVEG